MTLPRRDKGTIENKSGLEDGLDTMENEGRVIERQWLMASRESQ